MTPMTVAAERPSLKKSNGVPGAIEKVTFTAGNPELSRVAVVEAAWLGTLFASATLLAIA
jgi:hypothetical protein